AGCAPGAGCAGRVGCGPLPGAAGAAGAGVLGAGVPGTTAPGAVRGYGVGPGAGASRITGALPRPLPRGYSVTPDPRSSSSGPSRTRGRSRFVRTVVSRGAVLGSYRPYAIGPNRSRLARFSSSIASRNARS